MAEVSFIKRIEATVRTHWDRPALTNYGSGVTYTYGDAARLVACLHVLFEDLGVVPGDRIAVCDRNCSNWSIAMVAIMTYGAVAVPLLPDYSASQIISLCDHCGARLIFSNKRVKALWGEGGCPVPMIDLSDMLASTSDPDAEEDAIFSAFLRKYPYGYSPQQLCYRSEGSLEDIAIISYTSGSTGHPKGVMIPYRSLLSNAEYVASNPALKTPGGGTRSQARYLVLLPMAHMFGFTCDFLSSLLLGCHVTILTKAPVPSILIAAINEVRPDVLYTVPLVMEKIIVSPKADEILSFLSSTTISEIIMGGAGIKHEVEEKLSAASFRYSVGYGMTECGPLITHDFWPDGRVGSCGRAVTNMEIKVASADPQTIPGEILVRGANVMRGYFRDPLATAEAFDSEGWLRTGDLGVIDADGYLYIRGRLKNVILGSNGQNIYPEEAEEQVLTYSIFDECLVVQRDCRLVALVYISDAHLDHLGISRDQAYDRLEQYRREINLHLPAYCQLASLEPQAEEFEKTPKHSIRRFLYK